MTKTRASGEAKRWLSLELGGVLVGRVRVVVGASEVEEEPAKSKMSVSNRFEAKEAGGIGRNLLVVGAAVVLVSVPVEVSVSELDDSVVSVDSALVVARVTEETDAEVEGRAPVPTYVNGGL